VNIGNLSLDEMERRTGVQFPQELRSYLEANHQDKASDVAPGKWHCFDVPFKIVCGSVEVADLLREHLDPLVANFKEPLQVSITWRPA
jgi:hypothetical protein